MVSLDLTFKKSSKLYCEGELVQTELKIQLEKPTAINNAIANFVGLAGFTVPKEIDHQKSSKGCKNTVQLYFDEIVPLLISQENEKTTCASGIKVLKCHFQLPAHLPTSIESTRGFVRYSVHVFVDAEGEIVKKTEHFSVLSKIDLSENSSSFMPGIIWQPENQCIFQALFCSGNRIRAFVHIVKQGYIPGERLFINAEVSNFHRYPIEWVKASLIQIIKYKGVKSITEKRVVCEIVRGCIMPRKTQTWRYESVCIPAIPPTSFKSQRLITVKYKLLFQYKPLWLRKHIELQQKIIIGTANLIEYEPRNGEGEGICNSDVHNNSNLQPCMFGPHFISEGDAEETSTTFSPIYPLHVSP